MARGLLCRILDFMLSEGWLKRGSTLLDPFSGVGTTSIEAASRGIQAIGVELEEKFHKLGLANLELHRRAWETFHDPIPVLLNGDSRQLASVLQTAGIGAVVSSPPYAETHSNPGNDPQPRPGDVRTSPRKHYHEDYGHTEGQLGSMPTGTPPANDDSRDLVRVLAGAVADGLVGSPPYAADDPRAQGTAIRKGAFVPPHDTSGNFCHQYGHSPGQLGALPPGEAPQLDGLVGSPPYAESVVDGGGRTDGSEALRRKRGFLEAAGHDADKWLGEKRCTQIRNDGYGHTPGQLGALPPGEAPLIDGLVGSPPWAGSIAGEPRDDNSVLGQQQRGDNQLGKGRAHALGRSTEQDYGTTPGQLGDLAPGEAPQLDGIVGSPPYEATPNMQGGEKLLAQVAKTYDNQPSRENGFSAGDYGHTEGQLGNDQGDTFWAASATILRQCRQVLKPGAVCAWVLKMFVRDKKLVDFPGQWQALCESVGFETILIVHASLITEDRHPGLFGEDEVKTKKKASFFRRLAEKKGSPAIDHEVVLFCRRLG